MRANPNQGPIELLESLDPIQRMEAALLMLTSLPRASDEQNQKITTDVLKLISVGGIDFNTTDTGNGHTPLINAIAYGYDEIALALIDLDSTAVNRVAINGHTALIYAAESGNNIVALRLLERQDIKVNIISQNGGSALSWASNKGNTVIVNALLHKDGIEVDAVDPVGKNTALFWAVNNGHGEVVSLLLKRIGTGVNKGEINGPPLTWAGLRGYTDITSALLAHDDIIVNAVNAGGETAIFRAAKNGHLATVVVLSSDPRVDINAADANGCTAFMMAAYGGYTPVVLELLKNDQLEINAAAHGSNYSALILAGQNDHPEIVNAVINSAARSQTNNGDDWRLMVENQLNHEFVRNHITLETKDYINQNFPGALQHFPRVVHVSSMEEAVDSLRGFVDQANAGSSSFRNEVDRQRILERELELARDDSADVCSIS